MRTVIPDPISFRQDHPVNRRNLANGLIDGGNGRPAIQPRQATKPGNVSMFDHLQAIRTQAEAALEVQITWQ